jgi:hypothetical protein
MIGTCTSATVVVSRPYKNAVEYNAATVTAQSMPEMGRTGCGLSEETSVPSES